MARYEALSPSPLTGNESLTVAGSHLSITVSDFWRWAFSDLVTNTTRGYLAEFIVGKALDLPQAVRAPWDDYDLITASGLKIEVKSCAYLQAWGHDELSRISFSIAPRTGWDAQTAKSGTVVARKDHRNEVE